MSRRLNGVDLEQSPKWWGFDNQWPNLGGWCAPAHRQELIDGVFGSQPAIPFLDGSGSRTFPFVGVTDPSTGTPPGGSLQSLPSGMIYAFADGTSLNAARAMHVRWGDVAGGENRFLFSAAATLTGCDPGRLPDPGPWEGPPAAASCSADLADLVQIPTPNGGFETDATTHWTHNELGGAHRVGPGSGDWEGSYYYDTGGAGFHLYTLPGSYSFAAGTPAIARIRAADTGASSFIAFGAIGASDFAQISAALGAGAGWFDFCVEWTPSATRTSGVVVQIGVDSGLDNFDFDDVRIYTGS
jgi:hypothetical protein